MRRARAASDQSPGVAELTDRRARGVPIRDPIGGAVREEGARHVDPKLEAALNDSSGESSILPPVPVDVRLLRVDQHARAATGSASRPRRSASTEEVLRAHRRPGRQRVARSDRGPPTDFGSVLGAFQRALQAERDVSAAIDRLYPMAVEQGDYAAQAFLQWFVTEQVERRSRPTRWCRRSPRSERPGDAVHRRPRARRPQAGGRRE